MNEITSKYKIFRLLIETETLLDDFAPVLIEDINQKVEPIFELKKDYVDLLNNYFAEVKEFDQFESFVSDLRNDLQQVNKDFQDCEENINYFTLVFMGGVSAGKTSMICDFLKTSPEKLNELLTSDPKFELGEDEIIIAGEVATENVYEFLVEKSHLRLVDIPGTGGVVHDNKSLIPFINKAECIVFLSNAGNDLTKDDYKFILNHVVGLENNKTLTEKNASNKKALIVVNKWDTTIRDWDSDSIADYWNEKTDWILNGSRESDKFSGLAELFKRDLTIVPANTYQRFLNKNKGTYKTFGDSKLNEMLDSLKNILLKEGIALKLQRPQIILKDALKKAYDELSNQQIKSSINELTKELKKLDLNVYVYYKNIINLLENRLPILERDISHNLSSQIEDILESWNPNVEFLERVRMLNLFEEENIQIEIKTRWQAELKRLFKSELNFDYVKEITTKETNYISEHLRDIFKNQLENVEIKIVDQKNPGNANSTIKVEEENQALLNAVNKAIKNIELNLSIDIVNFLSTLGIDTISSIITTPMTILWTLSVFIFNRIQEAHDQQRKAKQEIKDAIENIADDLASEITEKIADGLRKEVKEYIDSLSKLIDNKQISINKPIKILENTISEVVRLRGKLGQLRQ